MPGREPLKAQAHVAPPAIRLKFLICSALCLPSSPGGTGHGCGLCRAGGDEQLLLPARGVAALGLADRHAVAGVVRAHTAARSLDLRLLVGARLVPLEGPEVLCYPRDRAAWARLCRLLPLGKRRAEKGDCRFTFEELL